MTGCPRFGEPCCLCWRLTELRPGRSRIIITAYQSAHHLILEALFFINIVVRAQILAVLVVKLCKSSDHNPSSCKTPVCELTKQTPLSLWWPACLLKDTKLFPSLFLSIVTDTNLIILRLYWYQKKKRQSAPCTGTEALYRPYGP